MNPLQIEYKHVEVSNLPETISETDFPGLLTIKRPVFGDDRGDFWEIARIPDIEVAIQQPIKIQQLNRSRNNKQGTLRGIHVAEWYKLISVVRGEAFIALVDLRLNSPMYGKLFTTTIGDQSQTMSLIIPPGFGNSYQTLTDTTDYLYAVTDTWAPGKEIGIIWNDPLLQVNWPISSPILSPKDEQNALLKDLIPDFKEKRK